MPLSPTDNLPTVCAATLLAVLPLTLSCSAVFTSPPPEGDDFETPFEGLPAELNRVFLAGDEDFERAFGPADGLGPLYNDTSCAACHPGDGPGRPENVLIRFTGEGLSGAPQLQDRATSGHPEVLPDGAAWSPRRPPAVFGVGLIEAIPEETILEWADPDDDDGDGISGRPNRVAAADYVPPSEVGGGPGTHLGRFGLKANVSSLIEQVVLAYQQDMGVTSDYLPHENHAVGGSRVDLAPDPEIPRATVDNTVAYVRLLRPPARGERTDEVERGEELFGEIGCADCHRPSMRSGDHPVDVLANREVRLYSDLLLHDMGDELADGRQDGEASGREWRTAPLWGIRIAGDFNRGPFFLHDGRARTIAEAIELHGGEGAASRDAFEALDASGRNAVVAFVRSL